MLKVTAQGTMINFPNAKCRLTMKNECVFMFFFPVEIHSVIRIHSKYLIIAQVYAA